MAGKGSALLSASVASLIALQFLSRLATFALNQALFRLASPAAFGAASIQLETQDGWPSSRLHWVRSCTVPLFSSPTSSTLATILCGLYDRRFLRPRLSPRLPLLPSLPVPKDTFLTTYFDPAALQLSFTLTLQSLVKHFFTEGDKLILSRFSPLRDQGGYAIAVNYGSLIACIIFQPFEESLRLFFSRTLNTPRPNPVALLSAHTTLTTLLRA